MVRSTTAVISCGIFRKELERIQERLPQGLELFFLDSMLHMRPDALDLLLKKRLDRREFDSFLLLYGDCSPRMVQLAEPAHVARPPCINCCEIFLGAERYHALQKQGVFLFMPEWTRRWKDVFQFELGFQDPKLAREFMQDMMSGLMYVDTGVDDVPADTLEEIQEYFAMPVGVEPAGVDFLEHYIRQALDTFFV